MTALADTSLSSFAAALASEAPAPGGGSASAAAGATGAGLLEMVVRLTLGKEKYRAHWEELERLLPLLSDARGRLLELVDEDTKAYDAIVAARKLPRESDAEKAIRKKAIDNATVLATTVPLQTAFFAGKALGVAAAVGEKGNPNAASDAFVAGLLLHAALLGALANVRINLPGVTDAELKAGFAADAEDLARKGREALEAVEKLAQARALTS